MSQWTPSIVAVGECMLELSGAVDGAWRLAHAGDTFNTTLYLARLGLDVAYLTVLGDDPFSTAMRAEWAKESIGLELVMTDPDRLPGLYAIRTDPSGERSFYYWRELAAVRRLFELPTSESVLAKAAEAQLLYLSGITLSLFDDGGRARLHRLAEEVRERGGEVAFDPNFRPKGWSDREAARIAINAFSGYVTSVLPTYDDEQMLHGDPDPHSTVRRWRDHGVSDIVVKLGKDGCLVAADREHMVIVPAATVLAIDTTGAGDSFNAGYIAARYQGLDRVAAASFATLVAAEVVRHPGGVIPASATHHFAALLEARSQ